MANISKDFLKFIEHEVGLPIETIREQSREQTVAFIEKQRGTKLEIGKNDPRVPICGSPQLYNDRVIGSVDAKFDARFLTN